MFIELNWWHISGRKILNGSMNDWFRSRTPFLNNSSTHLILMMTGILRRWTVSFPMAIVMPTAVLGKGFLRLLGDQWHWCPSGIISSMAFIIYFLHLNLILNTTFILSFILIYLPESIPKITVSLYCFFAYFSIILTIVVL